MQNNVLDYDLICIMYCNFSYCMIMYCISRLFDVRKYSDLNYIKLYFLKSNKLFCGTYMVLLLYQSVMYVKNYPALYISLGIHRDRLTSPPLEDYSSELIFE